MAEDPISPGKKLFKELLNPATGRVMLPAGTTLTAPHIKNIKAAGLLEALATCIDTRVRYKDLDGFEIDIPPLPDLSEIFRLVITTMPPTPPAVPMQSHGRKVLIVDDAAFMRMMLANIFKANGFECIEAVDGRDALSKYVHESPELVTLDITMPGIDGLTTLQALRKLDPKACVIMCTSSGHSDTVMQAIQLGARGYIKKPVAPAALLQALHDAGIPLGIA